MNPLAAISGISSSTLPPRSATTAALSDDDKKKLKDTAVQLEATFTSYLMQDLSKGLPGSAGGFASQVFGDMFKQSIATQVAQSHSGSGLANTIYTETLKTALRQKAHLGKDQALPDEMVPKAEPVNPSTFATTSNISLS